MGNFESTKLGNRTGGVKRKSYTPLIKTWMMFKCDWPINNKFWCRTSDFNGIGQFTLPTSNMPSTITKAFIFAITHHTNYFIHFSDFKSEKVGEMSILSLSSTSSHDDHHPLGLQLLPRPWQHGLSLLLYRPNPCPCFPSMHSPPSPSLDPL